jgi:membrane fusion protein, multidrug efflux system
MRSYAQIAIVAVLGLGVYGASKNWNVVHSYIPASVVSALGPLLPAPTPLVGAATAGRPAGPGGPGGGAGGQAPVVEVLPAKNGVITEVAEAVGTTRAFESIQLNAKLSGIVEAISFNEGATVKAGDELLRIDSAERKADLQAAKAAITQEEAKRNELKTKLDRALQLRRSGAGTEAAVDDLAAQVKTSDSAIQNAIAKERASSARLNDAIVRAPFAGRVGIRQVSVGSYLETRTNITTLDDISRIRLDFQVPESLLAKMQNDAVIRASSIAFGARRFEGKVAVVDTRIDPVTRSVKLTAIIDNADLTLRPGMFMNVWLDVAKRENALLIPEEAIVGEGPLQIAFVVKDNKIERRIVKLGQRENGQVEVTDGVKLDEVVVVRGLHRVRGGLTVTARPLGAAPPAGGPPAAGGAPRAGQSSAAPAATTSAPVSAAQAAPANTQPTQRQ